MWQYILCGGGPRVRAGLRLVETEYAFVIASLQIEFLKVQNRNVEMKWMEEMKLKA